MSEQATQTKRPKKGLVILFAGIGVLLVAVIVLLVILLLKKEPETVLPAATPGTGNVVVDEGFDPEAMRQAASEMFEVKMSNLWEFPDGASPASDAYVANSQNNSYPFYFELVLPGPDEESEPEVLYTSPVIPIGSATRDIQLARDLDAGEYECSMLYHLLNEDNTVKSTISFVVRVRVAA